MLPVVAVLALCSACSGPQTGRLSLTTAGEATLPEELSSVDIDWDDGVTWTREVTCAVSGVNLRQLCPPPSAPQAVAELSDGVASDGFALARLGKGRALQGEGG